MHKSYPPSNGNKGFYNRCLFDRSIMKAITQHIQNILDESTIDYKLLQISQSHPDTELNLDTTGSDLYNGYIELKATLINCIANGYIDKLPSKSRSQISSSLDNLQAIINSHLPAIAQRYEFFAEAVLNANCYQNSLDDLDSSNIKRELLDLRRRYRKLVQDISNAETDKTLINNIKDEVISAQTEITNAQEISEQKIKEFTSIEDNIKNQKTRIEQFEQDVENRKKAIVAFAETIEANDAILDKMINEKSKAIDSDLQEKQRLIEKLITSAEQALELKSAEGISAAYSSGFSNISSAKLNYLWMVGAVIFSFIALVSGFLLAGGELQGIKYQNIDSIYGIVGRFAVVAVSISAAAFCANGHLRWKNLEEDYRYKSILSKSIVAFANKIKEVDESKVPEYLNLVLSELHQDPLRSRKPLKEDKEMSLDYFNKVLEFFDKAKKSVSGN